MAKNKDVAGHERPVTARGCDHCTSPHSLNRNIYDDIQSYMTIYVKMYYGGIWIAILSHARVCSAVRVRRKDSAVGMSSIPPPSPHLHTLFVSNIGREARARPGWLGGPPNHSRVTGLPMV